MHYDIFRLFRITGSSHGPRRIEDSAKNSADVAAVFAGSKAVAAATVAAVAARRKKNSARSVWNARHRRNNSGVPRRSFLSRGSLIL